MKKGKGGGSLGVFKGMSNKATSSANIGVKEFKSYPSVNRMESSIRSSTAPTPDTLGPRKA